MNSTTTLDPIAQRLQQVQNLARSGKLSEAAETLNGAVKVAPDDPRVYIAGSRLAEASGNPKGAQELMRKAVAVSPYWPVAVTELSFLLARQNQFKDAIEFAERAVQLDGDNFEVLGRVIDVAHRAQNMELAMKWLERAIALAPDNRHIRGLLARDLRLCGEHDRSIAVYDGLLASDPKDAPSLLGRIQTRLAMGQREQAVADAQALLAAVPDDEEARFWSEQAFGRTPSRQPASVVRALYDGVADLYDQHVVGDLKYKLPRDVGEKINALYPDNKLNVLDLGCGTGLLGVCLGRIDGALVGVELSPPMINQATRHGVYDRFHNVDLLDALQETPAALYDVIAALDVFVYVGELTAAVPNAVRVLRDGGHFIFSCETAAEDEADMVLRPTQRYAHKASHVEALCRSAGFADISLEPMTLRYENLEPVQGFLVIASRRA